MQIWQHQNIVKTLIMQKGQKVKKVMGALKDWVKQDWVRIGTDGKIKGKCGTSKDKKNPDRCLPRSKANSLSQKERAATAKKKKREGSKAKLLYLILKQRRLQRWEQVEQSLAQKQKDRLKVKQNRYSSS